MRKQLHIMHFFVTGLEMVGTKLRPFYVILCLGY